MQNRTGQYSARQDMAVGVTYYAAPRVGQAWFSEVISCILRVIAGAGRHIARVAGRYLDSLAACCYGLLNFISKHKQ